MTPRSLAFSLNYLPDGFLNVSHCFIIGYRIERDTTEVREGQVSEIKNPKSSKPNKKMPLSTEHRKVKISSWNGATPHFYVRLVRLIAFTSASTEARTMSSPLPLASKM